MYSHYETTKCATFITPQHDQNCVSQAYMNVYDSFLKAALP